MIGPGIQVHSFDYTPFLSELAVVTAGISEIQETGIFQNLEAYRVTNVTKSGLTGTITYEIDAGVSPGGGDMRMRCWQGGYGIA